MIKNYYGEEKITDAEETQRVQIANMIRKYYSFKWNIVFRRISKAIGNDTLPADNDFCIDIK